MNPQMSVNEAEDLGDGKFSVKLSLETQSPEVALTHTETVSADGLEAAVQIAKTSFSRWLGHVLDYVAKHPKPAQP
jgi:hypothetical protein